ncbi:hypothetical protein RHGRI_038136 [Rhododendron griersonianum]|uniref:Bulb-type lectin domain-containing protein n=1 Tax=Rhododendron griersonianum TaxID=479676 RepID=A0AAV6HUI6_9ERIC|nr:hypothetical protein RHGRI_038136 [Rhododendron griersonianum]
MFFFCCTLLLSKVFAFAILHQLNRHNAQISSLSLVLAMAYALSHLLMLLPLLPLSIVAQSRGVVNLGSSLSANEGSSPWLSPAGNFAFGFQKVDGNLFLLSIWYDKIPEKTIIWYADEGNPVPVGSKLVLTDTGLQLTSPQGEQLWISEPLTGGVATGYMNDTGNFAIKDENSQESWGSFSTINIPTRYLNEPYYRTGTDDAVNSSNSGTQLVFNESGYMYVLRENGGKFMLSQGAITSNAVFYHRVTLNFDGVLTQYYHPKNNTTGNESWSVIWSEPDNICTASNALTGSGTCGYNSLCRLETKGNRPKCECPSGYTLLDPYDQYGSCKPNFTFGCEDGLGVAYDMVESPNADWPYSDYELLRPYGEGECRNSCLHDCMCAISIFRNETCWKKKLPLSNGRVDINSERSKAFVKVGKNKFPIPEPKKKNEGGALVIAGSVLLVSSVLVAAICLAFIFIYNKKQARIPPTEEIVDTTLRSFRNMPISVKVDVYSFGVLLLEIICCRKNVDSEMSGKTAILSDWAYDCCEEGTLHALVGDDTEALNDRNNLDRFIMVALWCIQEDPSLRPTMRKTIWMLEGVTEDSLKDGAQSVRPSDGLAEVVCRRPALAGGSLIPHRTGAGLVIKSKGDAALSEYKDGNGLNKNQDSSNEALPTNSRLNLTGEEVLNAAVEESGVSDEMGTRGILSTSDVVPRNIDMELARNGFIPRVFRVIVVSRWLSCNFYFF